MKIKPHVHKGRFYNDQNDAILPRVAGLFRSIWYQTKHRLKGRGAKRDVLGSEDVLSNWVVNGIPMGSSQELVVTWLGHATFLIQIAGLTILTDPVFFEISRYSPRLIPVSFDLEHLPKIDVVIISHNHRDHVDEKSLVLLKSHQPQMFVPMGKKQWFGKRGFTRVTEATWWDEFTINDNASTLQLTFLPASHWTSRGLLDINKTLWGSWMISLAGKNIYFAGDTAYAGHFKTIGKYFSPIDLALMPIGPNEPRYLMHDAHLSTEEAVQAFIDLGAQHFIPMHWGTFVFGTDIFHEPIARLEKAWELNNDYLQAKTLHVVKFGEKRALL